ncbi:hypothetical protein AUP68_04040 [Ilyonectria robusta]
MASIKNTSPSHRKWVRIVNKVDALYDSDDSGADNTGGGTSDKGQLPSDQGDFEEVCEAEGWGYQDACTILMWETMLNFRDRASSNTNDENNQIIRLYGEIARDVHVISRTLAIKGRMLNVCRCRPLYATYPVDQAIVTQEQSTTSR